MSESKNLSRWLEPYETLKDWNNKAIENAEKLTYRFENISAKRWRTETVTDYRGSSYKRLVS